MDDNYQRARDIKPLAAQNNYDATLAPYFELPSGQFPA